LDDLHATADRRIFAATRTPDYACILPEAIHLAGAGRPGCRKTGNHQGSSAEEPAVNAMDIALEHDRCSPPLFTRRDIVWLTAGDRDHMTAFPTRRKREILYRIQSCEPLANTDLRGTHQYEKTVLRLRQNHFQLIDIQPREVFLTSVWCKQSRTLLGARCWDVAVVLWVAVGDWTNLRTWRIHAGDT
jgi:hypothetical protein